MFDFVCSSPPWGGPHYNKHKSSFSIKRNDLINHFLEHYIVGCQQLSKIFLLFLPKSLDLDEIIGNTFLKKFNYIGIEFNKNISSIHSISLYLSSLPINSCCGGRVVKASD